MLPKKVAQILKLEFGNQVIAFKYGCNGYAKKLSATLNKGEIKGTGRSSLPPEDECGDTTFNTC